MLTTANRCSALDSRIAENSTARFELSTLTEVMEAKGSTTSHMRGEILFSGGEMGRGVHMVRKGRVKLTMDSADGKTLILKVAKPGDLLDLSACVLGRPHEVTAEAAEDCETQFLPRQDFMRLIQNEGRLCLQVALLLGQDFHHACVELTMLGLSHTAESRLAGLILRMMQDAGNQTVLRMKSTHEELGQLIGTSRETVTRVLARFRRAKVAELQGSKLVVHNPAALHRIHNMEEPVPTTGKMLVVPPLRKMQVACTA